MSVIIGLLASGLTEKIDVAPFFIVAPPEVLPPVEPARNVVVEAVQPDSAVGAGTVGKPTMEFSYDDGATWQPAVVVQGALGQWSAKFTAPAAAHFVSLRAGVRDSEGNSISQTVIRAFGVR